MLWSNSWSTVNAGWSTQVVNGARLSAESGGSWWRYAPRGHLCHQSGSGNNWSQGFHGYGPDVREGAMELVRREVSA